MHKYKLCIRLGISIMLLTLSIFSFANNSFSFCDASNIIADTGSDSLSYPLLLNSDGEYAKMLSELSYEQLKKNLQTQISQAKRKKMQTDALEKLLAQCEVGISSIRATNKVIFIDSIVVDKKDFLKAYKFDSELGIITTAENCKTTSYTTELGTIVYKTELNNDSNLTVNSYFIEDGELSLNSTLSDINFDGDINYPFLLTDGSTLYFASRNPEGLGNYDIYVTRYDTEDKSYLTPTNLGFPFNSYANDYMMVVDENIGIGWFASDRYQPEGKVCVYTFIQPKARHIYDYETDDHKLIINAAKINSIKDTWNGNDDEVRSARQALMLKQNQQNDIVKQDFSFIINDIYTYHKMSDFKNLEAKNRFNLYIQKTKELEQINSTLSQLRTQADGTTIKNQILKFEQQVSSLNYEIKNLAKEIRKLELEP